MYKKRVCGKKRERECTRDQCAKIVYMSERKRVNKRRVYQREKKKCVCKKIKERLDKKRV